MQLSRRADIVFVDDGRHGLGFLGDRLAFRPPPKKGVPSRRSLPSGIFGRPMASDNMDDFRSMYDRAELDADVSKTTHEMMDFVWLLCVFIGAVCVYVWYIL